MARVLLISSVVLALLVVSPAPSGAVPDQPADAACDAARLVAQAPTTDQTAYATITNQLAVSTTKGAVKTARRLEKAKKPAAQISALRKTVRFCNKVDPLPIFTQAGSGTATTSTFKVPSNWDLTWSYDCAALGFDGNFIVSIYDYYGQDSQLDLDNQGINQLGANGAGIEHYHSGGNEKYLEILSTCDWAVTITKG